MWTLPALLTISIGFAAWHYVRHRRIIQLGSFFNICVLLYMGFGLIVFSTLMGQYYESELQQISRMCIAAACGFNVAYLLANFRNRSVSGSAWERSYLPSHTSVLVFAIIGLACEATAILLTGPLDFLFSDRSERIAAIRLRVPLFYLGNLVNVCLPILLARYLRLGQRRDLILLMILIVHGLVFALATISRYDLTIVLLVVGYFLERYRGIRPLPLLCVLIVSFGLTLVYKPVLYNVMLGTEYHLPLDFGEYINWIRNTILMLNSPEVEMPHNGYGLALKSLVVMRPAEDSLAEWFLEEFFLEQMLLLPGIGYGFSGVWEGYSANGLIGVAMHFAFFGAVFGWLERSPSAMRQVFIVFALILTYRLFRSEAYNFVKTYAWYFCYPALALMAADKFLTWASGARPWKAG